MKHPAARKPLRLEAIWRPSLALGAAAVLLGALLLQWQTARSGRLHVVVDRLDARTLSATPPLAAPNNRPPTPSGEAAIGEASVSGGPPGPESSSGAQQLSPTSPASGEIDQQPPAITDASRPRTNGWGPATAKLQVEWFVNYHAAETPSLNETLEELSARYPDDVAVSVFQLPPFPVCYDCEATEGHGHPGGPCQAAQTAVAVAELAGSGGFRRIHAWLAARSGKFTEAELAEFLANAGISDLSSFRAALNAKAARDRLLADSVEARVRRIERAPAVFINGRQQQPNLSSSELQRDVIAAIQADTAPASRLPTDESLGFSAELQTKAVLATVRISNPQRSSFGSGVIIGERNGEVYVLTAAHLLEGASTAEVEVFSAGSYPRPREVYRAAIVVQLNTDDDLALVRFAPQGPVQSLSVAARRAAEELSLRITHQPIPVLVVGCPEGAAPTRRFDGLVADDSVRLPLSPRARRLWRINGPSVEGNSGGPLVATDGKILGIASGSSGGSGYYVHLSTIRDFLARSPYAWLLTAPGGGISRL